MRGDLHPVCVSLFLWSVFFLVGVGTMPSAIANGCEAMASSVIRLPASQHTPPFMGRVGMEGSSRHTPPLRLQPSAMQAHDRASTQKFCPEHFLVLLL